MRTTILAIIFALWLCLAAPISVYADQSALSIAPAILETITDPGKVSTASATLTNTTDFPLPIKGQVGAFITDGTHADPPSQTYNASKWFKLVPADFILQPHESKQITFIITPPPKTEPGGHYATVYFQPLIPEGVLTHDSTISLARIGVLTFLVVPGDLHESLELTSFTSPPWQTFGPLDLSFQLKNTGNIHLLPLGKLEIKNLFGKIVQTINLTPSVILPATTKDLQLTWDTRLRLGRYRAELSLDYGKNHATIHPQPVYFWLIPWPLIFGLLVLLTLLYKIFIVHIDRLKLAIMVLKGHNVQINQDPQESSRQRSRPRSRTHSLHSSAPRGRRRQSD